MTYLTAKQQQAAALLAQGKLCREVAAVVSVRPQTISTWKQQCEFQALVNALRAESLEAAISGLQSLAAEATATLGALLKEGSPAAVRLKAAAVVLGHAGLTDRQSGHLDWSIGPVSGDDVWRQRVQAIKAAGFELGFPRPVAKTTEGQPAQGHG